MSGTLFVVATPIGNLEDVTIRALRVLKDVAVIAAEDTRRTAHLLSRYAISTPTISLHEHNERTRTASLLDRLKRGDDVALVSDAGTPTISDPGRALVHAAIEQGFRIDPVPGPNAAIAALAASGFSGDRFAFLGFPPVKSKDRKHWMGLLREADDVVVFYEAPHRIRRTLQDVLEIRGDRPVLVARELTKIHQELVNSTISAALERLPNPRGEFTVVVDLSQKPIDGSPEWGDARAAEAAVAEFDQITENGHLGRRAVITGLAERYNIPPNELYKILEGRKKEG